MNIKKIIIQAMVGAILFTIISVILEKEYTQDVILSKAGNGLMFGVLYGIFIWARQKFSSKE
ncbi:hypothetical protein [Costertonia aggregata]|uniref:Uncharacterized protein n=1 Tax=Costertonia aggregata TaxID=343403 RepID=A0A7H9ARR2_9FLAO|nr:hypothetical protein [Costertonia aggregata]QLG46134.1 hypothetical protein HYG79_12505 [Costertonia aggregata]